MKRETVYVALGSNLGARERNLRAALDGLRATEEVADVVVSSFYETAAVGPGEQGPYLNAVVRLTTSLPARALLGRLLAIELACGRTRGPERNAPRVLDLDLLLYGQERIDEPGLQVPHPRMCERGFVLEPLRELAPSLVPPGQCESVERLARRVSDPDAVRRLDT